MLAVPVPPEAAQGVGLATGDGGVEVETCWDREREKQQVEVGVMACSSGCAETDSRIAFVVAHYAPELVVCVGTQMDATESNMPSVIGANDGNDVEEQVVDVTATAADVARNDATVLDSPVNVKGDNTGVVLVAPPTPKPEWPTSSLLEDIAALSEDSCQSASHSALTLDGSDEVSSYSGTASEPATDHEEESEEEDDEAAGGQGDNVRAGDNYDRTAATLSSDRIREARLAEARTQFIRNNPDLFEWTYFYSDDEEEQRSLRAVVQSETNSCMNWLSTKETFFLTFVEMFAAHVNSVAVKPIVWSALPAYHVMLECFWTLLRSAVWWDGICKRVQGEGEGLFFSNVVCFCFCLCMVSSSSLFNCSTSGLLECCCPHIHFLFGVYIYRDTYQLTCVLANLITYLLVNLLARLVASMRNATTTTTQLIWLLGYMVTHLLTNLLACWVAYMCNATTTTITTTTQQQQQQQQ
jgi:hypothetical protein